MLVECTFSFTVHYVFSRAGLLSILLCEIVLCLGVL